MADNFIYIPELNPVLFFDTARANISTYNTKHFEKWMFTERLYDWQQPEEYCQVWQTTDIIKLQFESTFDPIIVQLLDSDDNVALELPALVGLPNEFIPGTFSFEVSMSLAGIETGCYKLRILLGPEGDNQEVLISNCQYISAEQLPGTMLLEYWDSKRFHKDVIFASGVKFQFRIHGHFGFMEKPHKDEMYRDDRWNPAMLSSKSSKSWPLYFGDEFGIPDDIFNTVDEIWSCDNVLIDGKPFGLTEGKVEPIDIGHEYPKRGFKYMVEEGVNRNSRIFAVTTDTTKKLVTSVIVEAKVFGDTSNQGSANTVPVYNVE